MRTRDGGFSMATRWSQNLNQAFDSQLMFLHTLHQLPLNLVVEAVGFTQQGNERELAFNRRQREHWNSPT